MLETVLTAVIVGGATIAAALLRRVLYPPARTGGQAPAWVVPAKGRARRAQVSASGSGGLTVTMRGRAPIDLPRQSVQRRHARTRQEGLRVSQEFSVKLEWETWRLFLRPDDWRTLTRQPARPGPASGGRPGPGPAQPVKRRRLP